MNNSMKKLFIVLTASVSISSLLQASLIKSLHTLSGSLNDLAQTLDTSDLTKILPDTIKPGTKFGSFHKQLLTFFDKYEEQRISLKRDSKGNFINENLLEKLKDQLDNNIINFLKKKRLSYNEGKSENKIKKLTQLYIEGVYSKDKREYSNNMSQQEYTDLIISEIIGLLKLCSEDTFEDCLNTLIFEKILHFSMKNKDVLGEVIDKIKQFDEIKNNISHQKLLESYKEGMLKAIELEKNKKLTEDQQKKLGLHFIMKNIAPLYNLIQYSENNCRVIKIATDFIDTYEQKQRSKKDNADKQKDRAKTQETQKKKVAQIEQLLNSLDFQSKIKNGEIKNTQQLAGLLKDKEITIDDQLGHEIDSKTKDSKNSLHNMINYLIALIKNPSLSWNAQRGIDKVSTTTELVEKIAQKIVYFNYSSINNNHQKLKNDKLDDQQELDEQDAIEESEIKIALKKAMNEYEVTKKTSGGYKIPLEDLIEKHLAINFNTEQEKLSEYLRKNFWLTRPEHNSLNYSQLLSNYQRQLPNSERNIYKLLEQSLNKILNDFKNLEQLPELNSLNKETYIENIQYNKSDKQSVALYQTLKEIISNYQQSEAANESKKIYKSLISQLVQQKLLDKQYMVSENITILHRTINMLSDFLKANDLQEEASDMFYNILICLKAEMLEITSKNTNNNTQKKTQ